MYKSTITTLSILLSLQAFSQTESSIENCLAGQDLNAEDVDISSCPELPVKPISARLGNSSDFINLGAWELGQTAEGLEYKYGTLNFNSDGSRRLNFSNGGGSSNVNSENVICWAKGYYRLLAILQNPPVDYLKLRSNNFQVRFFQFQTDLRNGLTGYTQISSYRDHLVKWVTFIEQDGTCVQPTLARFETYLSNELERRGL